jgi:uncharacterized protein (TIGR03435 family)
MRATVTLLLASIAVCAFAQQTDEALEFEAASIKVNKTGSGSSSSHSTSGQLVATNLSLRDYIRMAFSVRDYQISGPDWLTSERFDIVAKIPPHKGEPQLGPRMQKLLEDRFKLKIHRESKEFPVYALVAAKGGAKIQPVENKGQNNTNTNNTHMVATQITMARLAEALARFMDRPVVDFTEMKGVYDVKLDWVPDDAGPDAAGPTLVIALQQQLGLRLQQQKAPIDLIVVDHVERTPIEN